MTPHKSHSVGSPDTLSGPVSLLVSFRPAFPSHLRPGRARNAYAGYRQSLTVDVDDSFGKRFRSFLGQIVPDAALNDPVRVSAREFLGIGTRVRMWCTIGIAFEGNGWHGDGWASHYPRRRCQWRSEEHTSELQSLTNIVCRLLLEK